MLAAVFAAGLAIAGPDAETDDDGARRIAELIDEAARRGEFDSALVLVDEAERLYPHHRWRFFRASILTEKGDCEAAIPEYEAYIALEDVSANVASAKEAMKECEEELEDEPPPPAAPAEVEPPPSPPPSTTIDDAPQPRWHRDPAGIALLTSGLAVGVAGTIVFFQGVSRRNRAENEQQLEDFESGLRRAQILGGVGIATIAVGSALAIGGIVRFAVVARRHKRDAAFRSPMFFRF